MYTASDRGKCTTCPHFYKCYNNLDRRYRQFNNLKYECRSWIDQFHSSVERFENWIMFEFRNFADDMTLISRIWDYVFMKQLDLMKILNQYKFCDLTKILMMKNITYRIYWNIFKELFISNVLLAVINFWS